METNEGTQANRNTEKLNPEHTRCSTPPSHLEGASSHRGAVQLREGGGSGGGRRADEGQAKRRSDSYIVTKTIQGFYLAVAR